MKLNELIELIENLPDVNRVQVPTEPTGFYRGTENVFSTEENWKDKIIKMVTKVCNENDIIKISFNCYYGREPKAGEDYYIHLSNQGGIDTANALSSGKYGKLD